MKIVCLLGSVKGELSVTRHYLEYVAQNFPEHEFYFADVGGRIRTILSDRAVFDEIIAHVRDGDGVLWASPVYLGGVPSQMKQFLEAVFADDAKAAFHGKYAASLVTCNSNYYDHTTLHYLQAVSEDLGLRYVRGYSGNRHKFPSPEERENLRLFIAEVLEHIREKRPTAVEFPPLPAERRAYVPENVEPTPKRPGPKVLLLTDAEEDDNLKRMAEYKGRNVVGFVTDEAETAAQTTALLKDAARRLKWTLDHGVRAAATFLSVGGIQVKRDSIYRNRLATRKDHLALKANGFYDYPRFSLKIWLLEKLLVLLLRNPRKRRAFCPSLSHRMLTVFKGHVELRGGTKSLKTIPLPSRAKQALKISREGRPKCLTTTSSSAPASPE